MTNHVKPPGLKLRGKIWHIDKHYRGQHLSRSTKTSDLTEAVETLNKRMEEIRLDQLYGYRRQYLFGEAAAHYIKTKVKRSLANDIRCLKQLMPFLSEVVLDEIHDGTLRPFIEHRYQQGVKPKTINEALSVIRHILMLAARSWRDDRGKPWLQQEPQLITLEELGSSSAKPYPLSWQEQQTLFAHMRTDLAELLEYKVNTELRDRDVCRLRWEWEYLVVNTEYTVFKIPGTFVKNKEDRLVIQNRVAQGIIDRRRENGSEYVFPSPVTGGMRAHLNNSAWKSAWRKAGLPVNDQYKRGVHNLKHTFGRRLRAAGVNFEDRQVLLGHTNGSVTTDYSAPEILALIKASNRVCELKPEAVLLRVQSRKSDKTRTSLTQVGKA